MLDTARDQVQKRQDQRESGFVPWKRSCGENTLALRFTTYPEELSETKPYSIRLEAQCEHRIPGSNSSGVGRYSVLTNLLNRNYSLGVLESNNAVALLSPRTLMSWKNVSSPGVNSQDKDSRVTSQ